MFDKPLEIKGIKFMTDKITQPDTGEAAYTIVDLNYVSLYYEDFQEAITFYENVFGSPENVDEGGEIYGWRMGSTWLTLFPSKEGTQKGSNPGNTEFAIQVSAAQEVDALYQVLIEAGAKKGWDPEDTTLYEEMRFCFVDDPFGVRIDIYYLLAKSKN
jgi:uncharacterized glyoxalase superfamily protein PhnB